MGRGKRLILSLATALLSYAAWLALFLTSLRLDNDLAEAVLWIAAPVVIAAGFTAGWLLGQRSKSLNRARFWSVFFWPLAGCFIGAAAFYWLGAMFIVFGMVAGGATAIVLRDWLGGRSAGAPDKVD